MTVYLVICNLVSSNTSANVVPPIFSTVHKPALDREWASRARRCTSAHEDKRSMVGLHNTTCACLGKICSEVATQRTTVVRQISKPNVGIIQNLSLRDSQPVPVNCLDSFCSCERYVGSRCKFIVANGVNWWEATPCANQPPAPKPRATQDLVRTSMVV